MSNLAIGINTETGEMGTWVPDGEGYVIRSQAQVDAGRDFFEQSKRSASGRGVDFTFTGIDEIGAVISALTTTQCGFLSVLQCYVDYGSNTLINSNKTPMRPADMLRALRLERKRSTFYAFLAACIEHEIITESDKEYAINPRYHFRGPASDNRVIRSYTTKIKQSYTDASKAADLGLIYRMLPFVNYELNALCSNPLERTPRKVRWLNGRELAGVIGLSETELYRRIKRLTVGEEYVLARITIGKRSVYMFNPTVFKRNSDPVPAAIQAMFSVNYSEAE